MLEHRVFKTSFLLNYEEQLCFWRVKFNEKSWILSETEGTATDIFCQEQDLMQSYNRQERSKVIRIDIITSFTDEKLDILNKIRWILLDLSGSVRA